jgi:hypothetical protein
MNGKVVALAAIPDDDVQQRVTLVLEDGQMFSFVSGKVQYSLGDAVTVTISKKP